MCFGVHEKMVRNMCKMVWNTRNISRTSRSTSTLSVERPVLPNAPRSLKLPYFYLQKAFLNEKCIGIPLFCRTKRTSELKITLFLPTKTIS